MTARLRSVRDALNIEDLRRLAKRRMPRGLFEFVDRGAEDEITLAGNSEALRRTYLRQRVGIDVSRRDMSTTLFGTRLAMPIGIATDITIPTKPKTRPCLSGSTVSCSRVIADVEKAGTESPMTKNRA